MALLMLCGILGVLVNVAESGMVLAAMWALEGFVLGSIFSMLLAQAMAFMDRKVIARLWGLMETVRANHDHDLY